ncbi:MAG: hypothetical protein PVG83_12110 [Acidimicrobiia bacterium]
MAERDATAGRRRRRRRIRKDQGKGRSTRRASEIRSRREITRQHSTPRGMTGRR